MRKLFILFFLAVGLISAAQRPRTKQYIGFDTTTDIILRGALVMPRNVSRSDSVGGLRFDYPTKMWQTFDGDGWQNVGGNGGGLSWTFAQKNITSATSMQAAFNDATTGTLYGEQNTTTAINGSVNGNGKRLKFDNGARITGATLSNLTIDAAPNQQIFDTTVRCTGLQKASAVWWGALKNYANPRLTRLAFQRAIDALADGGELVIPSDLSLGGSYYYLDSTLSITKNIRIVGEGFTVFTPHVVLIWPQNVRGIDITTGLSALYVDIENIRLRAEETSSTIDTAAHAISTKWIIHLKNVGFENWKGDGLHIVALTGVGNSDHSLIEDCYFSNNQNGVYCTGGDANIIDFRHNRYTTNRHWGYYSSGFLGNRHYNEQFDLNGRANDVIVNYGGVTYAAINHLEGTTNLAKRPDTATAYWRAMPFNFSSYPAWSASATYYSGGPYCVTDNNAVESFYSPYSEAFQPFPIISPRTFVYSPFDEQGGALDGVTLAAVENEMITGAGFYAKKHLTTDGDVTVGGHIYLNAPGHGIWFNSAQEGIVSAGSPFLEGKHLKIFSGGGERAFFDLSHYFTLWASPDTSDNSKKVATTEYAKAIVAAYRPPLATSSAAGIVKPDNTTITVDGSGVLSATPNVGTLVKVNDVDYAIAAGVTEVKYIHQSAARTVTLPSASGNPGRRIRINATQSYAFGLLFSVGVKTDDVTTISGIGQDESIVIMAEGSDWWKVGN